MRHYAELDMIIRGIVMTRGDMGATIGEIREDYFDIVCEQWPLKKYKSEQIIQYLMEIDGLVTQKLDSGLYIWYIDDIGSNVSGRYIDSNNNATDASVAIETVSENTENAPNNSYAIPPPRAPVRPTVTSSFVSGNIDSASISSSSNDTMLIDPIETTSRKRNLSDSMLTEHSDKRPRLLATDQLPLLESNLDFHNRNNGTNAVPKKITSTEIENSLSVQSELNGIIANTDYIAPIQEPTSKDLNKNFENICQITDETTTTQTDSVTDSSICIEDQLILTGFGIIGDDFMQSLMSFELYSSDLTDQKDKHFGYCTSGQTIREAFHLILDKQHKFVCKYKYLIVNVGAIDILLERDLVDIEAEYARLIQAIFRIGLQPIITTIPNFKINSNNPNSKIIRQTMLLFNNFLMNTYSDGYHLIDLYTTLSRRRIDDCVQNYHPESKTVCVQSKKLELWRWNENGRSKILNEINSYIGRIVRP